VRQGASPDTLIKHATATEFGANRFSTPFDGLVLSFRNDTTVSVIDSSSGWLVGKPTVNIRATPDNSNISLNVPWPGDYELKFAAGVADTTAFDFPPTYPLIPVNFTITNTTSGKRVKFIIDDRDANGALSFGDTIRVLDGYVDESNFKIAWKLTWERGAGATVTLPQAGDRFVFRTRKPFADGDYFTFATKASRTDVDKAKNELNRIDVVPNPYISATRAERRTLYSTGRGDRRIQFIRLPAQCTIRIFTIAGQLVKTLRKESTSTDGSLAWDLVTEDGMDIAFGLYLYHVDAPGVGEHIGKFAVIK
jgi:5-hydroxyisourate hydrolase-like protein (transthyretin family)